MDAKNRVTIPSRWRAEDDDGFFALLDPVKPVVVLLVHEELERVMAEVESAPGMQGQSARIVMRRYFSRATPCPVDRQGRLVLPADLCASAGLRGEVALVGAGPRVEIWDPEAWKAEQEATDEMFRVAADRLGL